MKIRKFSCSSSRDFAKGQRIVWQDLTYLFYLIVIVVQNDVSHQGYKEKNPFGDKRKYKHVIKGWLAIAKLKPLSLFIYLLLMLKKAFDDVKIEK